MSLDIHLQMLIGSSFPVSAALRTLDASDAAYQRACFDGSHRRCGSSYALPFVPFIGSRQKAGVLPVYSCLPVL
jgi:hypothetical protein